MPRWCIGGGWGARQRGRNREPGPAPRPRPAQQAEREDAGPGVLSSLSHSIPRATRFERQIRRALVQPEALDGSTPPGPLKAA